MIIRTSPAAAAELSPAGGVNLLVADRTEAAKVSHWPREKD